MATKTTVPATIQSCVVLGGGIAGLTFADALAERGVRVTLLERSAEVGGLCRGIPVDGSRVDLGPHNLRARDQRVLDLWRALIGDDLRVTKLPARLFFMNTLLTYPINPVEVIRKLGVIEAGRCGIDLMRAKAKAAISPKEIENYEQWAIANYGESLYRVLFEPLTEKVWRLSPQALDAQFAAERLPPLSIRSVLGLRRRETHREASGWSNHYYPRHGIVSLVDRLSDRLRAKGVRVITGARVERLHETAAGVEVVYTAAGESQTLAADYLGSSIPLPHLLPLLGEDSPFRAADFSFRGVTFLYLSVDESDRLVAPFIYCADKAAPFNRLTDFSYCSRDVCAPGKNILCVETHSDLGDLPRAYETIVSFLRGRGIARLDRIHAHRFETEQFVYPLYVRGYREKLNTALERLGHRPRTVVFGRQGLFAHINVDASMLSAIDAAEIAATGESGSARKHAFYGVPGREPAETSAGDRAFARGENLHAKPVASLGR